MKIGVFLLKVPLHKRLISYKGEKESPCIGECGRRHFSQVIKVNITNNRRN